MKKPEISVIISTYNALEWLRKTLTGYKIQDPADFELVIADDGSSEETRNFIETFSKESSVPVIHVWQEDDGFQKTKILNKAILACNAEYILMSDGDCIPRKDFVRTHLKYREEGCFLSGGYFKLPIDISEMITEEDIISQKCFEKTCLKKYGLKSSIKNLKLSAGQKRAFLLNNLTPTGATWNGHNASGWKKDILAVNGFDERMQYGGEDRELGERLFNYGIKSKQIRYSAVCVHLEHPRGYKTPEAIAFNKQIRRETREGKKVFTPYGIVNRV